MTWASRPLFLGVVLGPAASHHLGACRNTKSPSSHQTCGLRTAFWQGSQVMCMPIRVWEVLHLQGGYHSRFSCLSLVVGLRTHLCFQLFRQQVLTTSLHLHGLSSLERPSFSSPGRVPVRFLVSLTALYFRARPPSISFTSSCRAVELHVQSLHRQQHCQGVC